MKRWDLSRCALTSCVAAALLSGCGTAQTPIGLPNSIEYGAKNTIEHRTSTAKSSFRVLYTFAGGSDGAYPTANLIDVNGTLYGTTGQGGGSGCYNVGCGTVYSISTDGVEKVLYRFKGSGDGATPLTQLADMNGTLYGTTVGGGTYGQGTVYSIKPKKHGSEKVLYSFQGGYADGSYPSSPLTEVNDLLYGTTDLGGAGWGTVYSVSTTGAEMVLHRFAGSGSDGQFPQAGLTKVNGILYGTTEESAVYGCGGQGTVYSITTNGKEKVVYCFAGGTDGSEPLAPLTDVNGMLYSTTSQGGITNSHFCSPGGCGTVFSVTKGGREAILHDFGSNDVGENNTGDGNYPTAGLVNVHGILYGTTGYGGDFSAQCGIHVSTCGTVFSISPTGVEAVVHYFGGGPLGWFPMSGLLYMDGTLYGTTAYGGNSGCSGNGCGIVFALRL